MKAQRYHPITLYAHGNLIISLLKAMALVTVISFMQTMECVANSSSSFTFASCCSQSDLQRRDFITTSFNFFVSADKVFRVFSTKFLSSISHQLFISYFLCSGCRLNRWSNETQKNELCKTKLSALLTFFLSWVIHLPVYRKLSELLNAINIQYTIHGREMWRWWEPEWEESSCFTSS